MSKQPICSIIVPFEDQSAAASTLASMLESPAFRRFEVLLVGDGTGSAIPEALAVFSLHSDDRVRYYGEEKSGLIGHLRNVGIQHARTDWFYFVDSDCRLDPSALGRVEALISSRPRVSVFRGRNVFEAKGLLARLDASIRDERYSRHETFAYCPNLLVAKTVFAQLGLFNAVRPYGSDGDFARRIEDSDIAVEAKTEIAVLHNCSNSSLGVLRRWVRLGEARYHRYRNDKNVPLSTYFPSVYNLDRGLPHNAGVLLLNICRAVGMIRAWLYDRR